MFLAATSPGLAQEYVVKTIAGGGVLPPTPALSVGVGRAEGIAADAANNMYFTAQFSVFRLHRDGKLTQVAAFGAADTNGLRVRRITPKGTITTLPGDNRVDSTDAAYVTDGIGVRRLRRTGLRRLWRVTEAPEHRATGDPRSRRG
jgi:hypothetical protein